MTDETLSTETTPTQAEVVTRFPTLEAVAQFLSTGDVDSAEDTDDADGDGDDTFERIALSADEADEIFSEVLDWLRPMLDDIEATRPQL